MTKATRFAAAIALAAMPVAAFAADPHGGGGGGMPQLRFNDPMLIAQVVWLLIIFGVLYYLMSQIALPRVAEVLENRRNRIEGDLEAARTAKASADAAMEEHRVATARARAEAQAAIATAVQQAQDEAAKRADVLNAKLNAQIAEAESRIGAARDAAMGALRQVSTDTAEALVAKLMGSADRNAVDAAVGRTLAARGQA